MITQVYYSNIAGDQKLKYAVDKNEETGEERVLERHELLSPNNVEVGDEEAYRVHITQSPLFNNVDS